MTKVLNEALDHEDMKGQIEPTVTVDEYAAKMGEDEDIVTIAFTVKNKSAGQDLVGWFEGGYNFVLDSQVSDGEVTPGKFLVFVEMQRRHNVPRHLCELLSDLETLTGMSCEDYTIKIDNKRYKADPEVLKNVIVATPAEYRRVQEKELNEMRELSGNEPVKLYKEQDSLIKDFISKAGL